jgi:hypothetical protein
MRRVILSATFAISTLTACIYLQQPAHANQLDDIQEELETQSFEADMRHDEVMDALRGHQAYQPAPTSRRYWTDLFGGRHACDGWPVIIALNNHC